MSKIALGTVQFGLSYGIANCSGKTDQKEALKIISFAKSKKINTIDTAIGYGDSEKILGEIDVTGFQIVTKLPPLPLDITDLDAWVKYEVEESCSRLQVKNLYAVLLHKPTDLLGDNGPLLARALHNLKDDGIVKKVGVSIYAPEDLALIAQILNLDLVQAPLNVIDRRLVDSGWLHRLKDMGVEVHTRSVFLQGLLLMSRENIPTKFNRWESLFNQWHLKLKAKKITPLSACLAYPLSLKEVDRVVVGVDSAAQLSNIIETANDLVQKFDTTFMSSKDIKLINPSLWNTL